MTTKLGIHVSAGKRDGFGDFLQQCADSGNPASVIFALDQDVWPDVQKYSPKTKVIYRTQPDGDDNPNNFYGQDATQMARDWMARIMPSWSKNKANYYAPMNEMDIVDVSSAKQLNDFTLECMRVADANGYKLANYAFSGGNPRDSADSTLEQKWQPLLPSMQYAKQHGHILLLHEYSFTLPSLRASEPDLALRYRRSHAFLQDNGGDVQIVISECSSGTGYGTALSGQKFVSDMAWYDSEAKKDSYLMGFCCYQAGGVENLYSSFGLLVEYVTSIPVEEPMSRGLPRVQYARTVNVIPTSATDQRAAEIFLEGWKRSRETATGSYDDAAIGDLDSRVANLYDIPADKQADYTAFYAQYYPGVVVNFLPKA